MLNLLESSEHCPIHGQCAKLDESGHYDLSILWHFSECRQVNSSARQTTKLQIPIFQFESS